MTGAGLGALLTGLAALMTAVVGVVALLRPRPQDPDDDDVAAWRDRALAAEQRADRYERLWLDCEHTGRARGASP